MTWSACVALRRLHQWQVGLSRSSSRRAFLYWGLSRRLGIGALSLPRFAWPSALTAFGCLRFALAGRADGLAVDDGVAEFFCQVCFAAVLTCADVDDRRVGEFVFHVVCLSYVTCDGGPRVPRRPLVQHGSH
jgi:hypothetical protein